jgi:DNA-binding transcriptional regulator/RsmH inhibitor MraZ
LIIREELLNRVFAKIFFIEKKDNCCGLYDHLEIWDESLWNKYKTENEKNSNMIAEKLGDLGI